MGTLEGKIVNWDVLIDATNLWGIIKDKVAIWDVYETYLVPLMFEFLGDRISHVASLGDIDDCPEN